MKYAGNYIHICTLKPELTLMKTQSYYHVGLLQICFSSGKENSFME